MRHHTRERNQGSCCNVYSSGTTPPLPASSRASELVLCEPTELYNILNQATKFSRLTEPNYLCLLDVRSKREYDEGHLITARRVKQERKKYLIPESVDLECVRYCVVYDSNTTTLEIILEDNREDEDSDASERELVLGAAVECGKTLTPFTCNPIYILKGGYETFSAMYHFFRTQKIIWMPQVAVDDMIKLSIEGPQELDAFEPYPVEILPGRLYMGNFSQACNPKMHRDLKVKAHINVSMEAGPFFINDTTNLLHIRVEDSMEANIAPSFRHLCHFIDIHLELGSVILVFSKMGISRSSAAVMAYLMHRYQQTLKRSWNYVKKCKSNMCPNQAFVHQLLLWEKAVVGGLVTDVSDLQY